DKSRAEADANNTRVRLEEAQARIDVLNQQVSELRRQGGGGSRFEQQELFGGPLQPLQEGTRGTVTAFDRDSGLVQLSIGLDAGVTPGAVLNISRLEGGGKYLGTVYVTDARPKAAVAVFKPVSGKPMGQPKPDE